MAAGPPPSIRAVSVHLPAGSPWGRAVPVTCCWLVAFPQSVGASDSGRSPASVSERPLSKSQGSRSQPQQNSTSSSSTNKHPTNAHSPGRWLALRKHRGRASTVTPPSAGARQVLTCIPILQKDQPRCREVGRLPESHQGVKVSHTGLRAPSLVQPLSWLPTSNLGSPCRSGEVLGELVLSSQLSAAHLSAAPQSRLSHGPVRVRGS